MTNGRDRSISFDVRTKLLVMLAVLSLPLLIISLVHLASYQRSLNEQARTIARIETAASAAALEDWLAANRPLAEQFLPLDAEAARSLYARLQKHAAPGGDAALTVFDARGQVVQNPSAPTRTPAGASEHANQQEWNDGVERVTSVKRVEPYGWSVAVGVPLPEDTPAGRAILVLTATWALALLASTLLGVWAVGRFTKPLRELAESVSTFGEGRLHERFASFKTDDEVGTLATSFNKMAKSLQAKFVELRSQGAFIEEVLDSLPLGVAVLDSKLVVQRANRAFASFVGRDAAQLNGRGVYEAAAGLAALSEVFEDVRRTRRAFVNYGLPLQLSARDAQTEDAGKFWDVTLWPTIGGGVMGGDLIVILSEVSKRVRAEKLATDAFAAEKARAAELASVINQMNEGVIIVDSGGRYRVNTAA
ncbi:MAG TPA: HAMP domain-containing protein, partial [Pyrinomonadaceae bacterium]|nr:HAMP domain-containing protein [Pyrinomonadaceae bacterium]